MSDVEETHVSTVSSGKSEAEVAFSLLNKIKGAGVWGERNIAEILDMYAECLDAARGLRTYEGQQRVDIPIRENEKSSIDEEVKSELDAKLSRDEPKTQDLVRELHQILLQAYE